jgi:peptidoglycan/xylan/chitin deacetylase (PgdA/CDA1 family)
MDRTSFVSHLVALSSVPKGRRVVATQWDPAATTLPVLLTFDDGGSSAMLIADLLEEHGWRGHFFVATDFMGTRGFCTPSELRDLHDRGHVIGSHSCSHPLRMAACDDVQLRREWSGSVKVLADVLGSAVVSASVPGGAFSSRVATFAEQAGIRTLFNSEPVQRPHRVGKCLVLGRYTLRQDSPADAALALVRSASSARRRQWIVWNAKKVAKVLGASAYLRARAWLFERSGNEQRQT